MGSIIRVGACAFGASLITGCLAPAAPPSSSLARPQSAPAAPTARAQGGSLALVILRQSAPDARSREAGVDAIFDRSHGAHTCPELAKEQLCVLLECPAGLASATVFDAGAVTVTANEELTVERGDNGRYSAWIPRATLWSPGQPITVKVAGAHDNPPAFATRLSGPGPITVLQPSGNDIVVERNRGLVVTWTKGVGQEVGLMLEPTPMRPRGVSCHWPMGDGSHFVSPRVLGGLPAGPARLSLSARSSSPSFSSRGWTFQANAGVNVEPIEVTLK